MKKLIQGKDFIVMDITTDNYGFSGCDTCDYGSVCTSEVYFDVVKNNNHMVVSIKASSMYHAPNISLSDVIIYFCKNYNNFENITMDEFVARISREVFKDYNEDDVTVAVHDYGQVRFNVQ
jgi:hypothetical protein